MPTRELSYPFAAKPEPGALFEVAPGVFWVRMVLPPPFSLDHINLWALADEDGWTLVDTGYDREELKEFWRAMLAGPLAGKPVRRVVVTHFHPDHMGLAGWLTRLLGVDLWTSEGEWAMSRALSLSTGTDMLAAGVAFYRRAGVEEGLVRAIEARGHVYAQRVTPVPCSFRRLAEGDSLRIGGREWRIITGTGHAIEHVCLHCPELGVLISGDQVLPRLSPIISVWPWDPDADPLTRFLASLEKLRALPAETLVLPAHNQPFTGLHHRLDSLKAHHERRLAQALAACGAEGATAFEVLAKLFPRALDDQHMVFAIGESLAHLHCLMRRGQVRRESRGDGVHMFASTEPAIVVRS